MANYINLNFCILYALALCCLFLWIYFKRQPGSDILIILIFFCIGCLHQINFDTVMADDIYYLCKDRLSKVYLKGRVASQIQEGPFDKSFVFFPSSVKTKDFSRRTSGRIYVRFPKYKRVALEYGDYLTIEGKLSRLKDAGYFNKNLIRRGIRCALAVGRGDWITKEGSAGFSLQKSSWSIKEKLKENLGKIVSPAREFLIAIILGDRDELSKEIYSVFKYTGTAHILAISGLHIGIVILILHVFLKAVRLKLKARFMFTILFLLLYSFLTGLRPSVVRAVIMGITFLLSFIVKREYHIYNSLSLAAIIILAIWPWQIFDVGFQLSFISVLGIVFISPKILFILPKARNRYVNFFRSYFVVSVSAWLGATPLVAYYFGIISLISLVANVFIVLLMPFIIAGGFVYLLINSLVPFLAKWFALSLEFMIGILIYLAIGFKNIPFAYFYIAKFPSWVLLIYYGLFIIFLHNFPIGIDFGKRFPK